MGGRGGISASGARRGKVDASGEKTGISEPKGVFGPGRRTAAARAIGELAQARAAYKEAPVNSNWERPKSVTDRLSAAKKQRALYSEYGDSFRG